MRLRRGGNTPRTGPQARGIGAPSGASETHIRRGTRQDPDEEPMRVRGRGKKDKTPGRAVIGPERPEMVLESILEGQAGLGGF